MSNIADEDDEISVAVDIPGLDDSVSVATPVEDKPTPAVDKRKKLELSPGDFYFGSTLGEGAYARVVHARKKNNPKEFNDFAVKIMEKEHIKKENKVLF